MRSLLWVVGILAVFSYITAFATMLHIVQGGQVSHQTAVVFITILVTALILASITALAS